MPHALAISRRWSLPPSSPPGFASPPVHEMSLATSGRNLFLLKQRLGRLSEGSLPESSNLRWSSVLPHECAKLPFSHGHDACTSHVKTVSGPPTFFVGLQTVTALTGTFGLHPASSSSFT